jgi:hypothetical protein
MVMSLFIDASSQVGSADTDIIEDQSSSVGREREEIHEENAYT